MKHVLILGSGGRVGRLLHKAWPDNVALVPMWHARSSPDPLLNFDILGGKTALARAIEVCDAVLCLAGATPSSGNMDMSLNTMIPKRLADHTGGRPVFLMSSAAVYGSGARLREDHRVAPETPYGRAKHQMEREAAGRACCLRLGNLAGADALLGVARSQWQVHQFANDKTPVRSYIGPKLLAQVCITLIERALEGGAMPDLLNIAAPRAVEMGHLLDAAALPWRPIPAPDNAIAQVSLDTTRLETLFAFAPGAGMAENIVADWQSVEASR